MPTVQQVLARKGRDVSTIDPDATVFDAIAEMTDKDIGALLVMEGKQVVGLVSEREYTRKVALSGRSSRDTRVRDIMLPDPPSVSPDTDLDTCMAMMTKTRCRYLPVMSDAELVGIISIGDLVAEIIAEQQSTIDHLERYIASG